MITDHDFKPYVDAPDYCVAELPDSGDTCNGRAEDHAHGVPHRIEELVKVYLVWDDDEGRWTLDPINFLVGDEPLDGLSNPAEMDIECECDGGASHEAMLDRACAADLPNPEQLMRMLAYELGFHVMSHDDAVAQEWENNQ